ncbi:hypothetical protein EI555_007667, partial [Monodon monoceros]
MVCSEEELLVPPQKASEDLPRATQELVPIHGTPPGSEDTHFAPSASGTHTHVSSEIAPADLKIPAGDSEGERRTVVEAMWAGRGAYLEAGAEGGGKCGYLPPHILNPAASPRLPYTAPGTPSQAIEGREVTSEGDHPPQTKGWGALGPTLEASSRTMSVTSGKMGLSLAQEILSHLGLANKTAAWGILRTFLSFSIDKDVQRLPRAIAGQ